MSRTVYPKELKESIFKKLAPPNTEKVPALAKETNIPKGTLYRWRTKVLENNPTSNKKSSRWSSSNKFQKVKNSQTYQFLKLFLNLPVRVNI